MSLTRLIPLLLLLSVLAMADNDKNFRVSPKMFKSGELMQPIADMAITKHESMILSENPTLPLKANTLFLRHKKGPKEYQWFSGKVDPKNYVKLHAFNLRENYLKPTEVVTLRFYATQNNRAFQDEPDIYFDMEYVYSPRVPKLYFKRNGQWQQITETDAPGIIVIDTSVAGLQVTSLSARVKTGATMLYPMHPGMYAFSFEAPGYMPYVDAISVQGGVVEFKPRMVVLDTSSKVVARTSVTREAVDRAKTLEECEVLFDTLTADMDKSVAVIDTAAFNQSYPPLRKPLVLSVAADDTAYVNYKRSFYIKRAMALDEVRKNMMGEVSKLNRRLRKKMDSLQALPSRMMFVPAKVEPVYVVDSVLQSGAASDVPQLDALVAAVDSVKVDSLAKKTKSPYAVTRRIVAVRLNFGNNRDRYEVSWAGNVDGYTPEALYRLLTTDRSVRFVLTLANNKPVWIFKEGKLTGRHHYRYVHLSLLVNNKESSGHGNFELPGYIFDQQEVQDWLNRPVEVTPQPIREFGERKAKVEDRESFDVNVKVPKVVRDRIYGTVALIDSGEFRYKGKVVSMSGFGIHTTEVTQQFFKETMDRLDSSRRIEDRSTYTGPRHPVHNITWDDASAFCKAIGGDLPTEAQWEFAGRADNNEGALWNLDENPDPNVYAVYRDNSYSLGKKSPEYGPQPVSSKKSNEWGIFDMSGNVAEWTRDKYFMFSFWVEKSNPTGALMGSSRIYKGGSWKDKEDVLNLTSSEDEDPRYWSEWIGFRCAFPRNLFEGK